MLQYFQKQLFYGRPLVAASELKSNISNTNLDKKNKLFYILILAIQTKQKFFNTLLTSMKI